MPTAGPFLTHPNPFPNLLSKGLRSKPDEVALASPVAQFSWRQLDEAADRLARHYLALGVESGDRVASLMPNRPALVIHYLACQRAGLVATPLNYRYMPPEMDHALEVSGASLMLVHAERTDDVAASTLSGQLARGLVWYGANDNRSPRYEQLMESQPEPVEIPPADPDAPTIIYFTSGSTGRPKGVTHTQRTLGAMMASIIQSYRYTPDDTILPGASFSHVGGSVFGLAALAAGAKLVVPRNSDAPEVLRLLREHRPTVVWMLPTALITMVRDHEALRDDFDTIRLCSSGGDKVSAELEREFTELAGFSVDEGYGMTEIGGATLSPVDGENRLGSVGKLCAGFEMLLRDDNRAEVAVGQDGRLWIRAPSNTIGYWENPQATAETIVDGWLDTGDMMQVDADGYLWFRGRKKQIIIHDGSNICPQEVEEAVGSHPAVDQVGVVGIHDLVHGENVRAYITLKPGADRPKDIDIIQHARGQVGYKAPEQIVVLDEMPLNATGKVDRVTLKRMAEEQAHR